MKPTQEQQNIINTIKKDSCKLLAIEALAGTGKTSVLKMIVNELKPKKGLYLSFNKSVAVEAQQSFPSTILCSTIHSFAYKYTVKNMNSSIMFFGYKNITEPISFESKILLIEAIDEFLLSKYTKIDNFINDNKDKFAAINRGIHFVTAENIFEKYIKQIVSGSNGITHNGYLKLFHMMLDSGEMKIPEFDFIAIDECQDVSAATFEVFKLLKSNKKIIVGDRNQSLYSFTHCINGFEDKYIIDNAEKCPITKTYRCSPEIAEKVELFMQYHLQNPNFHFEGTEPANKEIKTLMYISRTNSAMIETIINLIRNKQKFKLLRDPKSVFDLVMILLNLKENCKIYSQEWRHLTDDVKEFYHVFNNVPKEERKKKDFPDTPLQYIARKYTNDIQIKSAIKIITEQNMYEIYNAYEYTKKHFNDKSDFNIFVTTLFTSKGLDADKVILNSDINALVEKLKSKKLNSYNQDDINMIYMIYVACTRAKKELTGANFLDELMKVLKER